MLRQRDPVFFYCNRRIVNPCQGLPDNGIGRNGIGIVLQIPKLHERQTGQLDRRAVLRLHGFGLGNQIEEQTGIIGEHAAVVQLIEHTGFGIGIERCMQLVEPLLDLLGSRFGIFARNLHGKAGIHREYIALRSRHTAATEHQTNATEK